MLWLRTHNIIAWEVFPMVPYATLRLRLFPHLRWGLRIIQSQGESRIRNFFYGISGNNFQPLHQHLILVCADLQCFLLCARPSEVPVFNPLVQKEISVPFLSEYSDKKGYPQPFVIRIFLPFILRYARFPEKNMRIKIYDVSSF